MLTAVAAVGLVWCEPRPAGAMRIAANALGTDTDTIATMAGAILGATAEADPPIDVLDAAVFRSEARRLVRIASGEDPPSHEYPDLLHWSAPKTRADALARSKDGGLGREAHRRRSSGGKGVEARRVQGDHRGGCGIQRDADRSAPLSSRTRRTGVTWPCVFPRPTCIRLAILPPPRGGRCWSRSAAAAICTNSDSARYRRPRTRHRRTRTVSPRCRYTASHRAACSVTELFLRLDDRNSVRHTSFSGTRNIRLFSRNPARQGFAEAWR